MGAGRGRLRRAISAVAACVVAVPLAVAWSAPAQAHTDDATAALKDAVLQAGNWGKGMQEVGKLAQPLPLLNASPGNLTQAGELLKLVNDNLDADLAGEKNFSIPNGTAQLSSTVTGSDDRLLDVTLATEQSYGDREFAAAGINLSKAVTITAWATLRLKVLHTAAGETFIVRDADAPRINFDVEARLDANLADAKAAIGILGVALTDTAAVTNSISVSAHLVAKVDDPNNDGKLAFDTAAGHGTGELAAPGSLAGLLQVTFDPAGGKTGAGTEVGPGNAHAMLHLSAAPVSGNTPLFGEAVDATVKLDWNDITVGSPEVTTTGIEDKLAKFRNMSPQDLAAGLAQLAELIAGVQQSAKAGNQNLPFLKGTLADAVKINKKLVEFLDNNTFPKPGDPDFTSGSDPAKAGQPIFTSLQELLAALDSAPLKLLDTAALAANPIELVGDKLAIPLKLTDTATDWLPLDPGAAKVSGQGATFNATGFTLSADRFADGALVGQRVVAGTSGGTIKANTKNSITLDAPWIGGIPANTSPWVITSSDPHIGAVELGGALTKAGSDHKTGLRAANAQASIAQVKPAYTAKITIVLDLRDITGDPVAAADRVMLRADPAVPLFTAAFPVRTDVDFFTTAGFLKVKVGGHLDVTPGAPIAGAAPTDMIVVKFAQPKQDISLGNLFTQLQQAPTTLLDFTTSVKLAGSVAVSVPGATGVLGTGVSAAVTWELPHRFGDPATTPTVDVTGLADLFATDFNPDDPQAIFALVIEALQQISSALAAPAPAGAGPGSAGLLDTEIPVVGRSARQLLGSDESGAGPKVTYSDAGGGDFYLVDTGRTDAPFSDRVGGRTVVIGSHAYRVLDWVDGTKLRIAGGGQAKPADEAPYALRPELADAVDKLLAKPPQSLQDAVDQLNAALGEGSGLTFAIDDRAGGPYLRLGFDWKRAFHTAVPLNFAWDGARDLVSLDSSGILGLDVTGQASLGLLLPLKLGGVPLVDKNSTAGVTVHASASDVALAARVGPLSVEIGRNPDDPGKMQADASFALGGLTADGNVADLLARPPTVTTKGVDCDGDGILNAGQALCATAPVFTTLCSPDRPLSVTVNTALTPDADLPDLGTCFDAVSFDPLDFNGGIDGYLAKVEDALRLASFDGKLPLVGEDLQQGQRFVADVRTKVKQAIGEAAAGASDSSTLQNLVSSQLTATLGPLAKNVAVTFECMGGVMNCPISEIQQFRIQLTAQRGDPKADQGCAGDDCLDLTTPLDLGIPGLSLRAADGATGDVGVSLGWKLHLDLVLDRTTGFYVATHGLNNGDDVSPELQIGAAFDVPSDIDAKLAFIAVKAHKQKTTPLASAYFAIDLRGSATEESCFTGGGCTVDPNAKLTLAGLGDAASLAAVKLSATIDVDWKLTAKIDAGGGALSAMPGVSAVFKLGWKLDNASAPTAGPKGQPGSLTISFSDIKLDAGEFFSDILGPVLEKLKAVTGPLQPVIDTLYAPIPVLSDLSHAVGGDDVTLISLAETFSTLAGGPSLRFVHTVRDIITFVNRIPTCGGDAGACEIPIGEFQLDSEKALTTPVSPASAESLIDKTTGYLPTDKDLKTEIDKKAGTQKLFTPEEPNKPETSMAAKTGLKFPFLDKPASLFGLLLGQDVELISFDSGPLTLGFTWRQAFGPVYAPPPVMITLAGSASVSARIMAGLDTAGIRHAIEAAGSGTGVDPIKVLDGLYFKTADEQGTAVPVLTLSGEIAAGAQVTVLILSAGVEGGVRLTVGFLWNDPNNDGKFRLSEFLQRLKISPICLFTTSGELSVFLKVYITINLFLFSKTFDFTLVNAVLLDFRAQPNCDPPPPELAGVAGDTLVVFAGKFGGAERGTAPGAEVWSNKNPTYEGDVFKVYELHGANGAIEGFTVEGLGRKQEYRDANLKRVVLDARGYKPVKADKNALSVIFLGDGNPSNVGADDKEKKRSLFLSPVVVLGSDGKDLIRTGAGEAFVDGGDDKDVIATAELPGKKVQIGGGLGDDVITTSDGNATVAGDGRLTGIDANQTVTATAQAGPPRTLVNVIDWAKLGAPDLRPDTGSGADHITVGHGTNYAYGNGGDDVIGVLVDDEHANGENFLVGGRGEDTLSGGKNTDRIYTAGTDAPASPDAAGSFDAPTVAPPPGKLAVNKVDTGSGEDHVYGGTIADYVTSHSGNGQTGQIYGYGGDDVLIGGYGTDEIYGGPDQDYVIAEPSTVSVATGPGPADLYGPVRTVTHQPLPANTESQTKLLVGGTGRDHIIGGDGGSTVFGDAYKINETCADNTFSQPGPADQGDNDLILGGAGVEVVSAGSGNDRTDLGGNADRACGQIGDDLLYLGDGADKAWGGAGKDQLFGDSGPDLLFGNTEDDGLYGGSDKDTIEGNNGADRAFGGPDNDVIYGGSRAAAETDQGKDYLYGEEGLDRLVGDNGTQQVGDVGPYPLDLAGDVSTAGDGDVISGGLDVDIAYGGLGDDVINGNEAEDYLEGNNGSDVVHGDADFDEIIGGSSQEPSTGVGRPDTGDRLFGDGGPDLIAGDNARFDAGGAPSRITQQRAIPERAITLLDLGFTPAAANSGGDLISGGDAADVVLGQGGPDRIRADAGDDYAEGGPGVDWVEGDAGDDDLVGGSSTLHSGSGEDVTGQPDAADALFGGPGSDVEIGDNGAVLRPLPGEQPTAATVRLGAGGSPIAGRLVVFLDRHLGPGEAGWRGTPDPARYGADRISGGDGVDVAWGQDGNDGISGDGDGDYLEGNGAADTLRGDRALGAAGHSVITPLADPGWPGSPGAAADLVGTGTPDGQDDLIGGSSSLGFRDTGDVIEGNGAADVILGDNGSLLRTLINNQAAERVYTERYPAGAVPADATVARTHDPALPGPSTRFCTTAQATCEPVGAYGGDQLYGDDGDDGVWGQDGDDSVYGGNGNDDLFGELGNDTLFGDAGEDAILGDRGGVVNQFLNADDVAALGFTVPLSQVPQEIYTGFRPGYYDRRVDLRHDVDGDAWIGSSTSAAMPYDGYASGGNDRIRGGSGNDNIHAGYGDDLANGDSGGDEVFGASGSDVLWGGKGCDPVLNAATPDCLTNGVFDPTARGDRDRFVDHVFGGAGATSGPAVTAVLGSDLLDFKPRGTYPNGCATGQWPVTSGKTTKDPCAWFEMTEMTDESTVGLGNNQHHQGTDWIYGGWDRDVLQGDVAQNGPNPGDRLFDWNGAYNLYTHCSSSYGGYNDLRLLAPDLHTFLTQLAWGTGAGRSATDVTTPGTSAFLELAFTYTEDQNEHGVGSAYPSTPGHFDDPASCTD